MLNDNTLEKFTREFSAEAFIETERPISEVLDEVRDISLFGDNIVPGAWLEENEDMAASFPPSVVRVY
jgi:hypothetical protein